MTPELQALALQAVKDADPDGPGGLKLQAVRILRDRDNAPGPVKKLSLHAYVQAISWAMEQPSTTLTRAAKEKAIKELTGRLVGASENRAYADSGAEYMKPEDVSFFQRQQHRLQGAILRIAMAKTID